MSKILVTGVAGFIGFHVARRLLADGHEVVGIDNLSPYYDVSLKEARLAQVVDEPAFEFVKLDVSDRKAVPELFRSHQFERVVHLAAQAGVRYSLDHPHEYVDANLVGFVNVLEACRHHKIEHLVYASSSSVYGNNEKVPFSVGDTVDHPISLYAATKKANELMAHTYSHLYGLPTTGLRFFTVYGPWGRPDMAYFTFTESILDGRPIKLFNHGEVARDFTYIDDIVDGVTRVLANPLKEANRVPYRIFNLGNSNPVKVMRVIEILEKSLGRKAKKLFVGPQPGDVNRTYADITDVEEVVGFCPQTSLEEGLERFVKWYTEHMNVASVPES